MRLIKKFGVVSETNSCDMKFEGHLHQYFNPMSNKKIVLISEKRLSNLPLEQLIVEVPFQ